MNGPKGGYEDNPATNDAEVDAMIDHATDSASNGGEDPIPTEPPDWSGGLPTP